MQAHRSVFARRRPKRDPSEAAMKNDANAPLSGSLVAPRRDADRTDRPEEPRTLSWLTPWWLAAAAVLLTVLLAG
jgi:hypothetical protein